MPYDGSNYPRSEAAKILLKTADYIREHGWCQGGYGMKSTGERCVNMAMQEVLVQKYTHEVLKIQHYMPFNICRDIVNKFIRQNDDWDGCNVHWNDCPGRTKEEVIAALEGAAILAEEEMVK